VGDERATDTLMGLLHDNAHGRAAIGRSEVSLRVRTTAAHALGRVGATTHDVERRVAIVRSLQDVLDSPNFSTPRLKVASVAAYGMVALPVAEDATPATDRDHDWGMTRQGQLRYLIDAYDERTQRADREIRHWSVRAHLPSALAALCNDVPEEWRELATRAVLHSVRRHTPAEDVVIEGATLALGHLGRAGGSGVDREVVHALARIADDGKAFAKGLALLGLGRVAGQPGVTEEPWTSLPEVRALLEKTVVRGSTQTRPWAALSLGLLGRGLRAHGATLSPQTSQVLRKAAAKVGSPEQIGAYLMALALREDVSARELCVKALKRFSGSQVAAGQAALALGLLGSAKDAPTLVDALGSGSKLGLFMHESATGLALLGAAGTIEQLLRMLGEADSAVEQTALAYALATVGGARAVPSLLRLVRDADQPSAARAAFATALGVVCSPSGDPWSSLLAADAREGNSLATLLGGDVAARLAHL